MTRNAESLKTSSQNRKLSPMMQQWHAAKESQPDGILFFRMGDFYEFFHQDAEDTARLLGLTLTARSKGEDSVPMAGIPVKTLQPYLNKLIALGRKCVICDQVQDPSEAKGIVDREVTRIITPGTVLAEEALEDNDNNYLLAVTPRGFAWVDLSTGEFAFRNMEGSEILDAAQRMEPAECLVAETGAFAAMGLEQLEKNLACMISVRPDWCFDEDSARERLKEHFGTQSLEGFGVDEDLDSLGAAGALLDYLQETQRGAIGQIRSLAREDLSDHMSFDRSTRVSLELVTTSRGGERKGSLLGIMDKTVTAMGARRLKAWILAPLLNAAPIIERQDAVEELVMNSSFLDELRRLLKQVLDLERLSARVASQRANARDLRALCQTLSTLPKVCAALEAADAALVRRLCDRAPDLSQLCEELKTAIREEPALGIRDGGIIAEGYDANLDELRQLSREGKGFIAAFQAREAEATGIPNLKIGFNRVFGYYLEVTNSHKDKVPDRYQRKQTLKNAERYITEELKEYEDRVLNAEDKSKSIEYEIFLKLRTLAASYLDGMQDAAAVLAELDVLQSLARLALDDGYTRPELRDSAELQIREGRHPVLVRTGTDGPLVPNDLELDDKRRIMLITGPNMAGKSTYIRQVALLSIMAQIGSFLPVKNARMGLVDKVFTRVGASDDLARGSSTFMVEMLEVANILNNATARSLVILDEVGRGTSTYDGLSLARAITEHLARSIQCKALFATHYHELTSLAEEYPALENFNVAVREKGETIVFLHKIVPGAADRSYGIQVARLAGLPSLVLERAQVILDALEEQNLAKRIGSVPLQDNDYQMTFFDPAPRSEVVAEPKPNPKLELLENFIESLNVNTLAPIDALNALAKFKSLWDEENPQVAENEA